MRTFGARLIVLAALVAVVLAQEDYSRGLRNLLEHKFAEMDDPKEIESLDVVDFESMGLVRLDGIITGMRIEGVHGVHFTQIEFNAATLECVFDFNIPALRVSGAYYDLRGTFGDLLPIFGNGPFTSNAQTIRMRGTARLAVGSNSFVNVASFRSTTSMDSLLLNFENLLMGGDLGDLMNYIMGDTIPFMLRNQQAQVADSMEVSAIRVLNEVLEGMTRDELLARILEFA